MRKNRASAPEPNRPFVRILIGPAFQKPSDTPPAFCALCVELHKTWNDESFGLLRLARLLLTLIQFVNPFMLLNHLISLAGYLPGMVFVDVFVLGKLIVPAVVLASARVHLWAVILCAYFIADTLLYLYGIVIIPNPTYKAISYSRSLLLIIVGYIGMILSFACLYLGLNVIADIDTPLKATYFSFVTAATVGFGDIKPVTPSALRLVIFQIFSSISFLTVFFAFFLGRLSPQKGKSR